MTKYLNASDFNRVSADASSTEKTKVRYHIWSSEDGVDDTFEVYSQIDGRRIAWTAYWRCDMPPKAERRAERNARRVARFLDLIANQGIYLELGELTREVLHWRITHGVEHMRKKYPDMTESEIRAYFQQIGFDQIDYPDDERSSPWHRDDLLQKTERA
jgi:hypothetical protein